MSSNVSPREEDFILPPPVEMSPEEAVGLITVKHGPVELSEEYLEADYTMISPVIREPLAYLEVKLTKEVGSLPYDLHLLKDEKSPGS